MYRQQHSAEEIRAEVRRRIAIATGRDMKVPLPIRVRAAPGGANWDMPTSFRRKPGLQIDIGLVLLGLKNSWALADRTPIAARQPRFGL